MPTDAAKLAAFAVALREVPRPALTSEEAIGALDNANDEIELVAVMLEAFGHVRGEDQSN